MRCAHLFGVISVDHNLRLEYLRAMGIDVWVSRQSATSSSTHVPNPIEETLQPNLTPELRDPLNNREAQTVNNPASPNTEWLFIIDTPGLELESRQLFNGMLEALGLNFADVTIISALKCSPPKDRVPHQHELAECRLFLQQQIKLHQPKIMLLLGAIATQSLLQTETPLSELRGIIHQIAAIPTIVTYDPRCLLRAQLEKRNAWLDLQLAMTAYQEVNRI